MYLYFVISKVKYWQVWRKVFILQDLTYYTYYVVNKYEEGVHDTSEQLHTVYHKLCPWLCCGAVTFYLLQNSKKKIKWTKCEFRHALNALDKKNVIKCDSQAMEQINLLFSRKPGFRWVIIDPTLTSPPAVSCPGIISFWTIKYAICQSCQMCMSELQIPTECIWSNWRSNNIKHRTHV